MVEVPRIRVIAGPDYVRCIPHMIRRANAAVKAGLNHVIDLRARHVILA